MRSKNAGLILFTVLLFALSATAYVSAQQAQTSSLVNLKYSTVQLSYPSQVSPGQMVSMNLQVNSKYNFEMDGLTVAVFVPMQGSMQQIAKQSFPVGVIMTTNSSFTKDMQFTVPNNSPTTSLIAVVTENTRSLVYSDWYMNPYYSMYQQQSASNLYPYNPNEYVEPTWPASDSAMASVTYVKAPDASYANLQSQYQNQSQQLAQAQSQNQQLQQQLQQQNRTLAQLNAQVNRNQGLSQQLTSSQRIMLGLEAGIVVLAVLVGVLAYLHFRKTPQKEPQRTSESQAGITQSLSEGQQA